MVGLCGSKFVLNLPSCSVPLPPPSFTSPIFLYLKTSLIVFLFALAFTIPLLLTKLHRTLDESDVSNLISVRRAAAAVEMTHWSHVTRNFFHCPLCPPSSLPLTVTPHPLSSPPSTFIVSLLVVLSRCLLLCGWKSVLNQSMSPLKTYPPCGFNSPLGSSASCLPPWPACNYHCNLCICNPVSIHKTSSFLYARIRDFSFFWLSICARSCAKAHFSGLFAYMIALPLLMFQKSLLALRLTLHTNQTCNGFVRRIRATKRKFYVYRRGTFKWFIALFTLMAAQSLLSVLCNHRWIYLMFRECSLLFWP